MAGAAAAVIAAAVAAVIAAAGLTCLHKGFRMWSLE